MASLGQASLLQFGKSDSLAVPAGLDAFPQFLADGTAQPKPALRLALLAQPVGEPGLRARVRATQRVVRVAERLAGVPM